MNRVGTVRELSLELNDRRNTSSVDQTECLNSAQPHDRPATNRSVHFRCDTWQYDTMDAVQCWTVPDNQTVPYVATT